MQPAPIPKNEEERLLSLHKLGLLDTRPEERFDRITLTATQIFNVPISTLTLIDSKREWFKSCQGLPVKEGDRAISFCGHALLTNDIFVVPDTKKDERFSDNPMVIGKPYIRFYAGVPIMNADGQRIGVFCIKDKKPRKFSKENEEILKNLSSWAELEINSRNLSLALSEERKMQAKIKVQGQRLEDAKAAAVNVLEDLQAEKDALALISARDEAILANMGDGLVVADLNRRVIFLNVSGERMLGWKAREVLGRDWFDVAALKDNHGQKIPLDESFIQKVLTTTTTTTTADNYFYTKKDGSVFPVSITASKISVKGKPIGVIAVFRDISKEKEVEKLRTDFLSLASHQLRTPLSGIKWLIETLNREVLGSVTEKQKEYLNQIYQINERMIKLVFDMLNALRFESGEALVKKETISIPSLYEEVSLMTASAAKNRGVELHNVLENHTEVVVETDIAMLRSILETFISNAINYSERGQEIFLDAKEEPAAAVFFVKDSGIGIPKEEQGKIFEKFYRSSNAKAFKPDGTGLGLYTASLLAQKIGAKIWFESEINKGTTFYLRVPKMVEIINNPIKSEINI